MIPSTKTEPVNHRRTALASSSREGIRIAGSQANLRHKFQKLLRIKKALIVWDHAYSSDAHSSFLHLQGVQGA